MQSGAVDTLLSQVRFFQLLNEEDRRALSARFETKSVSAGTSLFRLGDPGDELFVVAEGRVEVHTRDSLGQKIPIAVLGEGQIFGELSVLDGGTRTANATSETDCVLLVLSRDDLFEFVHLNPAASLDLLKMLAERVRETHGKLRKLAARNANDAIEFHESRIERITDAVAQFSGSLWFLFLHVGIFAVWIGLNLNPAIAFDPFPYGLLTMAVSLEAILLSVLVLLSQNRQAARDRIRSDVEYEVNVTAGMQIVELHTKVDTLQADLLGRLTRIERAASRSLPQPAGDS